MHILATMIGAFLITTFVSALRGNEVFMVDAYALQTHIHYGTSELDVNMKHVVVPSLRRFKNEDGEKWHMLLSVDKTESGLEVRKAILRLVSLFLKEGRKEGPAFCDKNGKLLSF